MTSEDQAQQMRELAIRGELDLRGFTILVEPTRRNTAPCIALALLEIRRQLEAQGTSAPEVDAALITVLPADHHVGNELDWNLALRHAASVAKATRMITCLGIVPDGPSSEYGYINRARALAPDARWAGANAPPTYHSPGFTEKPARVQAEALIAAGALWNAGVFVARTDVLKAAYQLHAADIWQALAHATPTQASGANGDPVVEEVTANLARTYASLRDISIDYAVMEHLDALLVVEVNPNWSDLGSWTSIANHLIADLADNRQRASGGGRIVLDDVKHSTIWSEGAEVIALGVEDLIIAVHGSRVLVSTPSQLHRLKAAVEALAKQSLAQGQALEGESGAGREPSS